MPAQATATLGAPQFLVDVTNPLDPHPGEGPIFCFSLEALAVELDEQLHWGKEACEEIAERVAAGEPFSEEVEDGPRRSVEVEARLAGGQAR